VIRVALVDDHPAVRVGLHAVLRGEPGLIPVPVPTSEHPGPDDVLAAQADVALVDGQLAVGTGVGLCLKLSRFTAAPPVVLYSAYLDEELAIAARLAGAAGALNKSVPLEGLLDTLRTVAGGGTCFPPVSTGALRRCADRLQADDLPFLSMLAHGTSREETADTLGVEGDALFARLARMVSTLEHSLMPAVRAASVA